jgi:hypothetical protein
MAEEGTLTFMQGQITQASAGRRRGSDALNWLSTWKQARYVFTPLASDEELPIILSAFSSSADKMATNPGLPTARVNTDRLESPHLLTQAYGIPYPMVKLSEATECIQRAGLSRSHRRLYLLIDGHRSAIELVPLAGKSAEEVRNMLHDLEWLGIIKITNPPAAKL